jgi:hypothetical protein
MYKVHQKQYYNPSCVPRNILATSCALLFLQLVSVLGDSLIVVSQNKGREFSHARTDISKQMCDDSMKSSVAHDIMKTINEDTAWGLRP